MGYPFGVSIFEVHRVVSMSVPVCYAGDDLPPMRGH